MYTAFLLQEHCAGRGSSGARGVLHAAKSLWHKQVLCSCRWENAPLGVVWAFCISRNIVSVINSSAGATKECRAVTNALFE